MGEWVSESHVSRQQVQEPAASPKWTALPELTRRERTVRRWGVAGSLAFAAASLLAIDRYAASAEDNTVAANRPAAMAHAAFLLDQIQPGNIPGSHISQQRVQDLGCDRSPTANRPFDLSKVRRCPVQGTEKITAPATPRASDPCSAFSTAIDMTLRGKGYAAGHREHGTVYYDDPRPADGVDGFLTTELSVTAATLAGKMCDATVTVQVFTLDQPAEIQQPPPPARHPGQLAPTGQS